MKKEWINCDCIHHGLEQELHRICIGFDARRMKLTQKMLTEFSQPSNIRGKRNQTMFQIWDPSSELGGELKSISFQERGEGRNEG